MPQRPRGGAVDPDPTFSGGTCGVPCTRRLSFRTGEVVLGVEAYEELAHFKALAADAASFQLEGVQ